MAKASRSARGRCCLFLAAVPVLLGVYVCLMDPNMAMQGPAWMLWSVCYLLPMNGNSYDMCSSENAFKTADWMFERTDWSKERYQPFTNTRCPEMDAANFSYKLLEEMTKGFTVPVVVRGLFKDSVASQKWTPDYFKTNYGDNVLITLSEGRVTKQYDNLKQTQADGKGYQTIQKPYKMKLRNALTHMEQGEHLYLSNVDTIFRKNVALIEDLEFGRVTPWVYPNYVPYAAQIFMGYGSKNTTRTTGTLFHCAASANLFIQVAGSKNWSFVPPRYSLMLAPRLGASTPAASVARQVPEGIPRMWAHIEKGDMLFNPPWMWHEIHNGDGFTVGIATREFHPSWILRNNAIFSFLLELTATPRVAKLVIPKDQVVARILASIPGFTFILSYIREALQGPQPHPVFTAAYNPCDEHDPMGCTSTMLDKIVYSDDKAHIEYRE